MATSASTTGGSRPTSARRATTSPTASRRSASTSGRGGGSRRRRHTEERGDARVARGAYVDPGRVRLDRARGEIGLDRDDHVVGRLRLDAEHGVVDGVGAQQRRAHLFLDVLDVEGGGVTVYEHGRDLVTHGR